MENCSYIELLMKEPGGVPTGILDTLTDLFMIFLSPSWQVPGQYLTMPGPIPYNPFIVHHVSHITNIS
jgi:hypothetical protein